MCEELEQSILQFHVDSGLSLLKSTHKENPPAPPSPDDGPIALRTAEAAQHRYEATIATAKVAKESIVRIHEILISAEHSFYQNVEHLRSYTSAKINAFVTGVRSSKNAQLSDYRKGENVVFEGTAYTTYKQVHEANDLIRAEFLEKLKEVI